MKPERIFLVRHGQSVGNVDRDIYKTVPDYALPLTDLGRQEAVGTGTNIKSIIGPERVQYYVSPFWRTRQTYLGIRSVISNGMEKYYEDPRLREQEWNQKLGSGKGYKDNEELERDHYGHFYYRFNGGESCADVFDRVSDFLNTLFRDFEKKDFPNNVIIVGHGMTNRLFLMRWFHASVEEFETWANPKNGEFYFLDRADNEKYKLVTPLRKHVLRHSFQFSWEKESTYAPYKNYLPHQDI
jgi:broad specificity phosphatase PhoE